MPVAPMKIRSRIAPTPSGYLHLGNAVNFIRTWLLVRRTGGSLKLRIDDHDLDRCRAEYVEDIFRQLDWLGLDWDEGPSGPDDFLRNHSQRLRLDRYMEMLDRLHETGHVFACTCSRKRLQEQSVNGLYTGECRGRLDRPHKAHALRMEVCGETVIELNGEQVRLDREMGDFVIWRRDNQPAYQLVSLADDLDDRINLIVRGEDLKVSTAAQLYLAARLGEDGFSRAAFVHHPLLPGSHGRKLSKSDNALSLAAMRDSGAGPETAFRAAALQLGLDPSGISSLNELADSCRC